LQLLTGPLLDDAPLEAAVSHALLERVGADELPETFRIAPTPPMVSFGRLDTHLDGFADAVRAAQAHGFAPVHRLAGGRAAAFHPGTVVFAWIAPDAEPRSGTHARFARLAALVAGALAPAIGVGVLEREYCPGDYSLHAAGVKVGGLSQRVARSASSTEGMIVVRDGERIRDVLVAVNAALGVDWDPATAGDLGGPSVADVQDALIARLSGERDLEPRAELDDETLALARRYARRHDASDGRPPRRLLAPAA
jgi:octanoyl-[GcvH]:protein N-octanoyltransferase